MITKRIWHFRSANLYADTMPDGRVIYRLTSHGRLVATDVTPKYLREIMYQVD